MSNPPRPTKPTDSNKQAQKNTNSRLGLFITVSLIIMLLFLYWFSTGQSIATENTKVIFNTPDHPLNNSVELTQINQAVTPKSSPFPTQLPTQIYSTPENIKVPEAWTNALIIATLCANELEMPTEIDTYTKLWQWLPQAIISLKDIPHDKIPDNCRTLSNEFGHSGLNHLLAQLGRTNWWKIDQDNRCSSIEICATQCASDIGYTKNIKNVGGELAFNAFLAKIYPEQSAPGTACSTFQILTIKRDFLIPIQTKFNPSERCHTQLLPQALCGQKGTALTKEKEACLQAIPQDSGYPSSDIGIMELYASNYGDINNECLNYLMSFFTLEQITLQILNDIEQAALCINSGTCPNMKLSDLLPEVISSCISDVEWNLNKDTEEDFLAEIVMAIPWLKQSSLSETCVSLFEDTNIQIDFWTLLAIAIQSNK